MRKNNTDKDTLLTYLAGVLMVQPKISKVDFNKLPDKPATHEVYRRVFKSWSAAKYLTKTKNKVAKPKEFDFEAAHSKQLVASLQKEVKELKKGQLTSEEVRRYIFQLCDTDSEPPKWLTEVKPKEISHHGVPSLLLSDFHMGEVVVPDQVFGVNKFSLDVGKKRIQKTIANTIDILTNHLVADHPGLVLLLNGDFVSGNIHEELLISNELPIMPVVLETYSSLVWAIENLQLSIPNIAVFCCHGNHSRTFKKPIHKDAALSSYDWLIYNMLERYFQSNKLVQFQISNNDDIQYNIYDHRYRMTHGGQFRGGQGFLGHIAPITRGEIRKRAAAESYGQKYDTLVVSHFHSYGTFRHTIVNGSLVGYSEYSMNNNYPYERPQQALWFTHPDHGITFTCPIFCTPKALHKPEPWVSWPKKKGAKC